MTDIVLPAPHHMTALEASPSELVMLAKEAGARSVCLFLNRPQSDLSFPLVTARECGGLARVLDGEGASLDGIDYFWIAPGVDLQTCRQPLELGARLGASRAVVLVADPKRNRAIEGFARFCAMAAEYTLKVGLEFMHFTPTCNSIEKARDVVIESGARNAGIGIDILHLMRTAGTVQAVVSLDRALISHAQICDGPPTVAPDRLLHEATAERMIPGTGAFPLVEFLAALPPGIPLDVEAPVTSMREQGVSARERTRLAMAGARQAMRDASAFRKRARQDADPS